MDPAHRDILRRHRGLIVRVLNVDRVKDSLIQNEVFDDGQWEDIATAGNGTSHDKASALMDKLPRRGPRAFWSFCESLMTGGYDVLAKSLIKKGARVLSGQIVRIRHEYQGMVKYRRICVMTALKKVGRITKLAGGRESERRVTSLKHIKEALKSHKDQKDLSLFDESEASALTDILYMVEKLKDIRNELQRGGSVSGYVRKINPFLTDGADLSDLYEKTSDRGFDYVIDLQKHGIPDSDIRAYGSVLALIPYLCDLSERAVQVMIRRSSSGVEDFLTSGATEGAYMQTPDYEEKYEEPVSPVSEELGQEDEATQLQRFFAKYMSLHY